MVKNLEDYQWSSHRAYLGLSDTPPWLNIIHTRSQFDKSNFIGDFVRFTLTDTSIDIEKYFSSKNHPPIIGTDEFIKKIKSTVDYQDLSCELSERKFFKPSITTIIATVAMELNVSVSSIKTPQRGVNLPRSCVFFIARKHFGYKLLELCEIAGIKCYQTVSHAARQFKFISQQDDKIAAMYLRALEIINLTARYPSVAL
jgi:hypothetical protein